LIRLLRDAIHDDRYPLSPRILTLEGILAKLDPHRSAIRCLPPRSMRHLEQLRPEGAAAGEVRTRSADDARWCGCRRGPADRVVLGLRPPGYAREVINKRFALVGKPYRRNALAASIQAAVERGKRVQGPVEAD